MSSSVHPFQFDKNKSLEAILYIANRVNISDYIHICKILYFADKLHLEDYGRFICGDYYVAMKNGPVPSGTYDILKSGREREDLPFAVEGYNIYPNRDANVGLLSESDIECLNNAIMKYGSFPSNLLVDKSHDAAWHAADVNSMISIESIAATLPSGDLLLQHLNNHE